MKCELSNNIKFLALKYHCLTKKSLERSFRWAKRNFDSYFKLIDKYKHLKKGYSNIYSVFDSGIGVPGFTKVNIIK